MIPLKEEQKLSASRSNSNIVGLNVQTYIKEIPLFNSKQYLFGFNGVEILFSFQCSADYFYIGLIVHTTTKIQNILCTTCIYLILRLCKQRLDKMTHAILDSLINAHFLFVFQLNLFYLSYKLSRFEKFIFPKYILSI